jgi:hypothetical protein
MPNTAKQNLLEEARTWQYNRDLYSRWLIAPSDVRDRIRDRTDQWLNYFVSNRTELNKVEEIDFLFELNWRLEVALIPTWDSLGPAFDSVLTQINPFPDDIIDLPETALTPNLAPRGPTPESAPKIDWPSLQAKWLALSLARLRYHREERQTESFNILHARLERIKILNGDQKARLCYEQCLFSLCNLDDNKVKTSLEQWPTETPDPFWAIRKAAILAEIDKTDEAIPVAQSALAAIRSGLSDTAEHIFALSRESWAMRLVQALRPNNRGLGRMAPEELIARGELRRRSRRLKTYGCDATELMDYFEGRLEQPPPRPNPPVERNPGFHPGTYSQTFRSAERFGLKLVPAYEYMRLIEEAGYPPRIGNVIYAAPLLTRAAEWFRENDPVRTQSVMLRLLDEKLIGGYLSRHRVAALPPETVARLRSIAMTGVNQGIAKMRAMSHPEGDRDERAQEQFEAGVMLLARTCVRDMEDGLRECWDLARNLYQEPAVRSIIGFGRSLRDLFTSLIDSTSPTELVAFLPSLFRLPIPGAPGFLVPMPDRWPDPASMVADSDHRYVLNPQLPEWKDCIQTLFTAVRSNTESVKQFAMHRLMALVQLGGLNANDARQLGKIFWAPVMGIADLPVQTWGPNTSFYAMILPTPPGIEPATRVKQYILSTRLSDVHAGAVRQEWIFDLIRFASERVGRDSTAHPNRTHIRWDTEDVRAIFEMIKLWWATNREKLDKNIEKAAWGRAFGGEPVRRFFLRLWDVMREIIIPKIDDRTGRAAILTLIDDVRAKSLPIGAVLPATLRFQPGKANEVAAELRREFGEPDPDFAISALRGVVFWVQHVTGSNRTRRFPPVPNDLLASIGMAVAFRHPDSLRISIDCAINVLDSLGYNADRSFVQSLINGLGHLLGELAYRGSAEPPGRLPYGEVPFFRVLAARLANRLSDLGYGAEPAVRDWLAAATVDPLPEVRREITHSADNPPA